MLQHLIKLIKKVVKNTETVLITNPTTILKTTTINNNKILIFKLNYLLHSYG